MRKTVIPLALPVLLACLFVSPAHAEASVGGKRLAGSGYVWDRSSKVAEPPHIVASSYVIADLETGAVLAAKNPHGHYRPASTLKTLTSITLIPKLDPHMKMKPSSNAVNATGSAVGMDSKWTYTVNDLFHGLLMQSGNDAAIALAEAYGGLPRTLAAMNAEAHRIQANDTVARTPNGLDDDPPLTLKQQHSSAYDLALIMKQGLKLPDFRKYVGSELYNWPAPPTKEQRKKGKKTGGYEIGTHDHLLVGQHYPGMIGGKNGWTSHALGSFVGAATRNGHTIVISLMHAQSDFWPDARELLDWGFAHRGKIGSVGTLVDPIPPPAKPKPKTIAQPVTTGGETDPAGGLGWWKIGLPGAALLAVVAGLAIGLRRRRPEPAPADGPSHGPLALTAGNAMHFVPPEETGEPDDGPPRRPPQGDVKVAGAPITSGEQDRPTSWATAPNPVTPDADPRGTEWTVSVPDRSGGDDATPGPWTVPIPQMHEDRTRGPFQPRRTGPDEEDDDTA
jgi:D-alanyl-D-alanine carboxypeptidase (penicillin-binding protein 5/6)